MYIRIFTHIALIVYCTLVHSEFGCYISHQFMPQVLYYILVLLKFIKFPFLGSTKKNYNGFE